MAKTELAEIIDVNVDDWTVTVRTHLTGAVLRRVQIGNQYCSIENGATMSQIPEVGAIGYVLIPDDKPSEPIMIGFKMPQSMPEGFRGGRPDSKIIQQGDAVIRTNGGSEILVKRDGSIIISAGEGMAQRYYSGKTNSIKDICGNYLLATSGGSVEWRPNKLLPNMEGISPVTLTVAAKKTELDKFPSITIELGDIFGEPDKLMRISLYNVGGIPLSAFKSTIDLLGNLVFTCLTAKIEALETVIKGIVRLGSETALEQVMKGNSFGLGLFWPHTHQISDDPPVFTGGPCLVGVPITEGQILSTLSLTTFTN